VDPVLVDWLALFVRWFHVIAGIMWIGSSLFFHWLDSSLEKPDPPQEGLDGTLWMVHSGGFYDVKKKHLQPHEMPPVLHWFRFEALFTLLSGLVLLVLVYYLGGGAYLLDRSVSDLTVPQAAGLTVGLLAGGWVVYDLLCSSPLARSPIALAGVCYALVIGVAYGLTHLLSGRAAFIHVGALLGTCMVANVWLRILPAQNELLAATRAGRKQDPAPGIRAKTRSRHNHYMTYPIVFIMISTHYPRTYGTDRAWLVLAGLFLVGGIAKYLANRAESAPKWFGVMGAMAAATIAVLYALSATPATAATSAHADVTWAQVQPIFQQRCMVCHSSRPTDDVFTQPPSGVELDTLAKVRQMAPRVRERAVTLQTMPLANKTGMTPEERALIGAWLDGGTPE
jgi:uncharacterized membrane protein